MRRHKFLNYWTSTETYNALKMYIDMDYDGLRTDVVQMLGGNAVLRATLSCDEEHVAKALDKAHMEVASILTYNDENSLACAVGLAYYSARKEYKMIRELPAGKGFADIIFIPLPHTGKPALVVELKYNASASCAIQQIKDRQYIQALEGYAGELLLIGISYDKDNKTKPHNCMIEKVQIGQG